MVLAAAGNGWVEVVVAASIFVPVLITIVLTWFFLRAARNDPDAARLRAVQEAWRREHRKDP